MGVQDHNFGQGARGPKGSLVSTDKLQRQWRGTKCLCLGPSDEWGRCGYSAFLPIDKLLARTLNNLVLQTKRRCRDIYR